MAYGRSIASKSSGNIVITNVMLEEEEDTIPTTTTDNNNSNANPEVVLTSKTKKIKIDLLQELGITSSNDQVITLMIMNHSTQ